MTSALRGGFRNDDTWWQGGGGVKNCQNGGDVICGCPLRNLLNILQPFISVSTWTELYILLFRKIFRKKPIFYNNEIMNPELTSLEFYIECYAAYLWTAGSSRNFDMCKKPYLKLNS